MAKPAQATSSPSNPGTPADAAPARPRVPDVTLIDHDGRPLRLHTDLMAGRTVLVNVMYTGCSNICSPATRNLVEARRLLGRDADGLHFVSMSLTPLSDPPEALRAYRQRHGIDGGWTFLTGPVAAMAQAQRAMGFLSDRPDEGGLLAHSALARLCDPQRLRWGHINTLLPPRSIARMIRFERV